MKVRWVVVKRLSLALAGLSLFPVCGAEAVPQNPSNYPLSPMSAEERGDLLMARAEYLAAIDAYHQAPMNAIVWNKLGIAYHHLLAMDEARRDYERALFIQPNYPEAINNLGAIDFAQGNFRQAIRLYRKALKLMPHSAVVAANLGTAYFAAGKFGPGLAAYRTAFAIDPNIFDSDTHQVISGSSSPEERAKQDYCIAKLFAQAGMKDRAIEYLRKAFDEGFHDQNRLMQDAVFAQLRQTAQFAQLMAEQKPH